MPTLVLRSATFLPNVIIVLFRKFLLENQIYQTDNEITFSDWMMSTTTQGAQISEWKIARLPSYSNLLITAVIDTDFGIANAQHLTRSNSSIVDTSILFVVYRLSISSVHQKTIEFFKDVNANWIFKTLTKFPFLLWQPVNWCKISPFRFDLFAQFKLMSVSYHGKWNEVSIGIE